MTRWLIALVLVAVTAPLAVAQPVPPGPGNINRREEIKKRIRALRAATLVEELKLDDSTSGRLFPLLAKWDDVTDKLLVQRVDLTKQLRAADQISDPKAIDRLIDDSVANQKAFWDLEVKRLAEIRKILTPAQTAKLLVVLPEFERRIQNQLKRAIQKQPGRAGGRRGRRNGPAEDFGDDGDDDLESGDLPAPQPQPPRAGPARQGGPPGMQEPLQQRR